MDFESLINKLSPTIKRIAYKLNGRFVSFNHDDLYQEALVHLWQDFNAGKLDNKTDSYILQGCFFHLKNYIRKAKIKGNVISIETSLGEEGTSLEEVLLEKENPISHFDYLNDKMLVEVIQNNGLTPREKYILSLCAEGLTTREIGRRLSVSHVRVVKIMGVIRGKCRKYIDNI